jgi:hypothetical protein
MRFLLISGLLLLAAAEPRAPEPGQLPAQTPAQDAAQEMIQVYQEFCLVRFPDVQAIEQGAAAHRMTADDADKAAAMLLGRPGVAWRLTTPKGAYDVAIETGGRQGCAVAGAFADDAGIRASFDLLVSTYAGAHEMGALTRPPLQSGLVKGAPASLQIIGAMPDGRPRQAFVNMATGAGPVMQVRLTRELAPS